MTTVYRAHCKETNEVTEHAILSTLVEVIATTRLNRKFSDYDWYSTHIDNKVSIGGLMVSDTSLALMKDLFNTYRTNKELRDKVVLLTEPAQFDSKITMVVDVAVEGLNMINQPYNPEYLLQLAVSGQPNGVYISNLQVDIETATDMFNYEVNKEYDYEYSELTEAQRNILGIEDFDDEDLIDPDEVPDLTDGDLAEVAQTLDNLPIVASHDKGKVTLKVKPGLMNAVRPTPITPRKM